MKDYTLKRNLTNTKPMEMFDLPHSLFAVASSYLFIKPDPSPIVLSHFCSVTTLASLLIWSHVPPLFYSTS